MSNTHQYNQILEVTRGQSREGSGFGLFSRIFTPAADGDYSWVNAHGGKIR